MPAEEIDVRGDFPFLERQFNGSPIVYFDNAATTQKPRAVVDSLQNLYCSGIANVHRAISFLADEVTQAYESSRQVAARFIGAHSREIIFVSNTTHGINLVAHALSRHRPLRVLTGSMEHHSNLLPWLGQGPGMVDFVPWSRAGLIELRVLEQKLRQKPGLAAFTHASNLLAGIQPIREIVALCRQFDVPVLIDASQSIAHTPVDVRELDCDFLVFSGHKIYGPSGIGVLYVNNRRVEDMVPMFLGGSMVKEVHTSSFVPNDIPYRFEAGTPNIEGAIALAAALRYVSAIGYEKIAAHENRLLDYARERLAEIPRLAIYSAPAGTPSAPIVTFEIKGLESGAVARALGNRAGVVVRSGFHCAQPAHEQLGIGPTVRASFGVYNRTAEIDIMVKTLTALSQYLH